MKSETTSEDEFKIIKQRTKIKSLNITSLIINIIIIIISDSHKASSKRFFPMDKKQD